MSTLCHKQTSRGLFDHFVGVGEQAGRNGEAERLAILRLMRKSNFVGCITGTSTALARVKMRSITNRPRLLCFRRRVGKDSRHTVRIDVESQEGQRVAAGISPLMHEAERLID